MGKVEIINGVETINGEGFQLTLLDKVIGAARANSVRPCHSLPLVVVSNTWEQWEVTTTWHVSEWNACLFLHARQIY